MLEQKIKTKFENNEELTFISSSVKEIKGEDV